MKVLVGAFNQEGITKLHVDLHFKLYRPIGMSTKTRIMTKGSRFLSHTAAQWKQGTTFSLHLHWHEALLHLQLEDTEAALDLYDQTIGPRALQGINYFVLL